jgi:hypothetical protein
MANMERLEHRVRTFEEAANGQRQLTRYTVNRCSAMATRCSRMSAP